MKRRQFLQFSTSLLASLGLGQFNLMQQGDRYSRLLAQNTSRKLALLVGINQYPVWMKSLGGCLTDVRMQIELLVHRYGFNPADILTLTDETELKPTRQNILDAFENHLIAQAKSEDVVVFHYSGHGSQMLDPDPVPELGSYVGTIVPADEGEITGKTLFLLMSALATERVSVILDSCHSGGATRGNLRLRTVSRSQENAATSEVELATWERWMSKLDLTPERLRELRRAGIAKGTALGSAQFEQKAADAVFGTGEGQFFAGAFTYTLTRYLWQQATSQSLGTVFVNLARSTRDLARSSQLLQDPVYQVAPGTDGDRQPVYFLNSPTPAAEAVVTRVGDAIEFWLGGISPHQLDGFVAGTVFEAIDPNGRVLGEVEQTGRVGLVGTGRVRSAADLPVGTLLREKIRGLPANLSLRLGLDPSLGNVLPQAEAALREIDRLEVLPVNPQTSIDYLLGRFPEDAAAQAARWQAVAPPAVGSIGLFAQDSTPIEGSFGEPGEAIAAAIDRLRPRLKLLLAGRILRLVANGETSTLNVSATIESIANGTAGNRVGSRAAEESGSLPPIREVRTFPANTQIQIQIRNDENRQLYIAVLIVASNGDLVVLSPANWDAPDEDSIVAAGQTLTVPRTSDRPEEDFQFIVRGPAGFFELLVLASTEPLRDVLRGFQQIAGTRQRRSRDPLVLAGNEPLEASEALIGDLDRISRSVEVRLTNSVRGIGTTQFAAISAMVEVVDESAARDWRSAIAAEEKRLTDRGFR